MAFIDEIRKLSEKALDQKEVLENEEMTKHALVQPFIKLLGYDTSNPDDVVAEYGVDQYNKRKKVDYAILKDGSPAILFECKAADADLDNHVGQLKDYFHPVPARFGVLTNGISYRFFSDIDRKNVMDDEPFLELNLLDIREYLVDELKKFAKESFDVGDMLSTASELKYTRQIKQFLATEYESPTQVFVDFWIKRVSDDRKESGLSTFRISKTSRKDFASRTKRAFEQFVKDHINECPKSPLEGEVVPVLDSGQSNAVQDDEDREGDDKIVTTEEEREGDDKIVATKEQREAFLVVKSILYGVVEPSRVAIRPVQNYCGILLDDNNRKPICRLDFNGSQKYLVIVTFDSTKKKYTKVPIDSINDINQYADHLKSICRSYDEAASE